MENLLKAILEDTLYLWIAVIIIAGVVEGFTLGITSIYFVFGGICAILTKMIGFSFDIQLLVFVVVSLVSLVFTRKWLVEKLHLAKVKTNTESLIGEVGVVIEPIEKHKAGLVKLKGLEWSALCLDIGTTSVDREEEVIVQSIEGVKLIVKRKDKS